MPLVNIDPEVAKRYGAIRIAYLIARSVNVTGTPPRQKKIARRAEAEIRSKLTLQNLNEDKIIGSWFDLGQQMGVTDEADLPAQIQLLRRILSGYDIPKINNVVDAANITAAQFRCPVGAFDLDRLTGNVTLRLARRGEVMRPLFASTDTDLPEGEVVYTDEVRVFSRYSKDADETKITETTKNIFCVVDGTDQIPIDHIAKARDSLASLLRDVGGTEIQIEEGLVIATE